MLKCRPCPEPSRTSQDLVSQSRASQEKLVIVGLQVSRAAGQLACHFPCILVVVVQLLSCLTLCDPMNYSKPGFPFLHCLPEFAQTCVY